MPNTLTIVFTSAPSTEPVEFQTPNNPGVYVTGTQQANGTWQVVFTGVTKGTYSGLTGRLKNFPAVSATIAANGPVLNIQQTAPAGTSASGSSATSISVTGNSSLNATAYRFLSATAQAGPYSMLATQAAATYTHTGLASGAVVWYVMQYVGGGFYDDSPVSAPFSGTATAPAPLPPLPTLKFTSAPVTSQQITSYLPPKLIASNVDFAATGAGAAVACATSTGSATGISGIAITYEAEGAGWTVPATWFASPANAANRGTGSMYSNGGPGNPISRPINCRYVDLYAQQDPTLGTLVMRLTLNGVVTTYPFPQSGTANSGAPNGTTPQITVDLGSIGPAFLEVYSSVSGQYCAFDAVTIRNSDPNAPGATPTPIATPITNGRLQLAASGGGHLAAVLPTKPVGGWWTVEADIFSAAAPTGIATADLFVGQYLDPNNYVGALFHATDGSFQAVARFAGAEVRSGNLGTGIALPGSIKVVCTGTGITVLYRSGTGPWVDLLLWLGPQRLLQNSQYGAAGWNYAAFSYTSSAGWDVQISNLRAGYFGAVCIGDNSMVLEETGQPVLLNGKRYWAGSLRGFQQVGITFPDFIRNNMCGILSEDVVTGVHELVSIIFHRHGTEIQGEGSPCFVREAGAPLFHSFTPAWHLAQSNAATETRNAYGRTPANLLTPGAYVIDAALRIYDAAKPLEMAYDTAWTKLDSGNWRGCTTVQYALGEQNQGFQMYGKVVNSTDLTQNVFTVIATDTTQTQANAYEGWRLLLYNGQRYFVGAGHTALRVLGMDGLFRVSLSQPTELQTQTYASHFAAYQTTVNGDPNRVRYIGFDGTQFRPNWVYAYGFTKAYFSDAV